MVIIIHYYLVIHHVYQSLNEYHKTFFLFNQSFAMNKNHLNIEHFVCDEEKHRLISNMIGLSQ